MSPESVGPEPESVPLPGRLWKLWALGTLTVIALIWLSAASNDEADELTYSAFVVAADEGEIATVTIDASGDASGELADGGAYRTRIPVEIAGITILTRLEAAGVTIESTSSGPTPLSQILTAVLFVLPVALLIGFLVWSGRRASGVLGAGMGRSKARLFDATRPDTTFDDVAGYDLVKAEIAEIVDVLRDPGRYAAAGAVSPRGVLMTGPPGTGKTLMARALAGEVGVPFLSVTGSSFVEMYVGVGAARVRDLFADARKHAPAIVFVDEIDAIGQRRQSNVYGSNDEREQTLNQLLSEMDGFDATDGIIVLAATNRPNVLDPALLRPGRFDRHVVIPLPNQHERLAILQAHCGGKSFTDRGILQTLARRTPGFSGADLANLVNEAAIRAARDRRETITPADIDAAHDRVLLGQRDGSNVLLPEEREAVATHEAGHAVVAALCANADPVHKVTILPAGPTLGATHQLPLHERHLFGEDYLLDTLAVQLGGRAAELEVFGQASTGAANDLASATAVATKMVVEYGLSTEVGPVSYAEAGADFLNGGGASRARPYSDETQRVFDAEVARLMREAQERARQLVRGARPQLDKLVDLLLIDENVEGAEVYAIVGRPVPGTRPQVIGQLDEPADRVREVSPTSHRS